ncbi:MAG: 16S rRNA (guanine(966)-N(2))-methyltransferase RsmD, partial [Deltaproteobacteria bacterium]|nr:16S rRNA (guanine(966)-N(2))-methyltransferase RsmD [Deltaproteobacteria bacterium]
APEGMDTRPTADRVKEALFSILQGRLYGTRVLDLYAGSGALALEALSRGAESAVLADCAAKACQVIQENIDALNCQNQARLLRMKDTAALTALQAKGDSFDLIFLDPPYRMGTAPICRAILEGNLLRLGGLIVIEHGRDTPPKIEPPLVMTDHREYGAAGLSFYQLKGVDAV